MDQESLRQTTEELRTQIGTSFEWTWDDRFHAMLSEYEVGQDSQVRSVLNEQFTQCWDQITIASAPPKTLHEAGTFSRLREGQVLYTYSSNKNKPMLAAIWPWGDGKTVSLRIKASD